MKIDGIRSAFGANTLLGQYLVEMNQRKSVKGGGLAAENLQDSVSSSLEGLRTGVLNLASKLRRFAASDINFQRGAFGSSALGLPTQLSGAAPQENASLTPASAADPSAPSLPSAPSAPTMPSVRMFTLNANKPDKFERQLSHALGRGYTSGNETLLISRDLHGEVGFEIERGGEKRLIIIEVDGSTTVKEFMDALNSQLGAEAEASLQSAPDGRLRIAVDTFAQQPPPPPPPEDPAAEPSTEEEAGGTPTVQREFLGSGRLSLRGTFADFGEIQHDLRQFVDAYNSLVNYVARNEERGGALDETAVDESLFDTLQGAFEDSKSDDGALSFEEIVNKRTDGKLMLNSARLEQSYADDPLAVAQVLKEFSETVAGASGVVRDYAARGRKIDQAQEYVQQKIVQQGLVAAQAVQENNQQPASDSQRLDSASLRLREGAEFLEKLGR